MPRTSGHISPGCTSMISRLHLSAVLLFAALVSGFVLVVSGVAVKVEWLTSMSATIAVTSLLLLVFERWAWRLRLLRGWFVEKPDLNGTWQMTLVSTWRNPETGEQVPEKVAYLVIRQSYAHLSLRLMTDESASELVGSSIQRAEDRVCRVTGIYRSEPRLAVRSRSPIHFGAIMLIVEGDPPKSLSGQYWTDRRSDGEFKSLGHISEACGTFDEAQTAFRKANSGKDGGASVASAPKAGAPSTRGEEAS